jgi:hypothetical protein
MSQHELFTTDIAGDDMYAAYLAAFPPGTDPIFRVATEHSCSTCRNFIRNIGNVVTIVDGRVVTVWDHALTANDLDPAYQSVALVLQEKVRAAKLTGIYRTSERQYGAEASREEIRNELGNVESVRTWNHFHGRIAAKHFTASPGAAIGEFNNALGVFKRGLEELTVDAISTVLDLISSNALYRGDEHKPAVVAFHKLRSIYCTLTEDQRELFLMQNAMVPASRFRNTVIGSLVIDLSGVPARDNDGQPMPAVPPVDLERAVKLFEQKVAPTNYKRPTALVTEGMKKQALATIQELGLEDSLTRRLAVPSDVSVNDVLWADNAARATMKGGIVDILAAIPTAAVLSDKAVDISIERFLADVLPKVTAIDLVVRNRHLNNFVALTAPMHGAEGKLFKWDNDFAWTYTGNISDSIKDRVKAAGGATDAPLRVSLAWHNGDDLDLHAVEPDGAYIHFASQYRASRGGRTPHGGQLDVDMNAGGVDNNKDPVENIVWTKPGDGVYEIRVNNYSQRSKSDTGYTLEIENAGVVLQFSCQQSPTSGSTHSSLRFTVQDGKVVDIKTMSGVTGGSFSQEKWGIATEQPARVSMVTLSPNYWGDNATGNRHYIFVMEGCKTDEPLRGILNEYLRAELEPHRKVFEVLGDRTKCQPTSEQLAGLGFSSTKGDSVTVNVTTGARRDAYNIVF